MSRVEVQVDIDAPLRTVWEAAADFTSHQEWMRDVESMVFETDQQVGEGTTLRVATRVGPFRTTDILLVTAWTPLRSIVVEHRGLVKGRGEFALAPIGGATRFTWSENLRFPWFYGGPIGAALARPLFVWIWRQNLAALKRRLEEKGA
ncbi:MAG: SRPBCC family protein [Actinomycetota bacterium]